MGNSDIIDVPVATLRPYISGDRLFGSVAAVVASDSGVLYRGVLHRHRLRTGFCAEHAAIAAMVTAGEYQIERVVTVWKDDDGHVYVLPPCGHAASLCLGAGGRTVQW